ncbi:MAG: hypothetical protein LR017_00565 [Candidatus Pacebacteria bacterium]|nr:hypothetical protein [Candidatus Paceibacterota bacterium]
MSQKWNLQDIKPPERPQRSSARPKASNRPQQDMVRPTRRPAHEPSHTEHTDDVTTLEILDGGASKRKRVFTAAIVAALILGGGFFMSTLLSGAEITVYPKFKDATVQATFTAHRTPGAGELSYELLTIEADGERQVSATGQEEVSERAMGDIFIYNAYSTDTQRLIKNTRFESPEGLIFRINESVVVPGATKDADGKLVPGVITATVFADGTGEQYNIAAGQFTIPGLKGSEQYDKMYATSNTGFMGGFEGKRFIIDDDELTTAKQALQLELRNALLARIDEERPAGFVLYPDAVTFAFDTLPATEYGNELATIKERARLQVPIFKESEFAAYLAKNTVAGYEGAPVALPDPFTLTFAYTSPTTTTSDIAPHTELSFNLAGQSRIVWQYNDAALLNDITGVSKTALPNVLSGYPAIERAEAVVRPFWKQAFPDTVSEIEVHTVIGDKPDA